MNNMKKDNIDLSSKATLVEQIIAFIMNDLKTASPGDKILPERALAKKYDVSRKTAKGAITHLTEQGLLVRRVGKGTFASDKISKLKDVLVNQLIYTDDFPHAVMSDVMVDINNEKELVSPSFFFGNYNVFDLYEESIQNMVHSEKKLDLVALDEGILPILAKDKLIIPLDDFLAQSASLNPDQFHPALLDAFSYKNSLYGIPQIFTMYVLFYNKTMFRKAGIDFPNTDWNWSNITHAAEKMTVADPETGRSKSFGLGMFHFNQNTIFNFIYQNFAPDVDVSSINVFKRPETLETFQWLSDILHTKKLCPPLQSSQLMTPAKMFSAGTVSMFIGSYKDYLELKDDCDHEWGVTELPGQKQKGSSLPVQGWGICAHSSCKDKSFKIIEQLLEEQRTDKIATTVKRIPAKYGHKNEQIPQVFRDSLQFASPGMEIMPPSIAIKKAYKNEICLFLNNFHSPEEFCNTMAKYCSENKVVD